MATFGNTNQSTTSYQATAANRFYGSAFTTPADMGTVTEIVAYIGSGAAGDECKILVHKVSDKSLVYTGSAIATDGSAAGRTTGAISLTLAASTAYYLGVVFETASDRFYKDTQSNGGVHEDNSFSTPTNLTSPTANNNLFQIYATYTPAATGETADLSFDGTAGISGSGLSGAFGSVLAPVNAGFVRSGFASSAGSVSMGATTNISPLASAVSTALTSFAANMGLVPSGLAISESRFTLSGVPSLTPGGSVTALADLSIRVVGDDGFSELESGPGGGSVDFKSETVVSFTGNVGSNGLVTFNTQAVIQLLTAILTTAGLSVSSIAGVSFIGTEISITIVTPADRIYIVRAEVREYMVLEESRIFRVPAESRVYLVS